MKLERIRNQIDKIDRELLVLLQERMGLALRSRKYQELSEDSNREEDTLERMERLNLDLVKSSFSRQLLKTIIDESKRLQDEDRRLVAFQGEHGAYGEVASRNLVPAGAYIPCLEFIDVFRGVEAGDDALHHLRGVGVILLWVVETNPGHIEPINDISLGVCQGTFFMHYARGIRVSPPVDVGV